MTFFGITGGQRFCEWSQGSKIRVPIKVLLTSFWLTLSDFGLIFGQIERIRAII